MARILLIEDNEMNRDMLARRLERKGYEVASACDGLQGLDMAFGGGFDLILMDMSLPTIDGWEAARRIKADDRTRAVPVIALTAHAMAGDREKALEAGCDDYDSKPVELPRLLAKIETWLAKTADATAASSNALPPSPQPDKLPTDPGRGRGVDETGGRAAGRGLGSDMT